MRSVQTMFDQVAGRYDRLNRLLSLRRDLAWRRTAVQTLDLANPRGPICDLCGGTGDFLAAYRRKFPGGEGIGDCLVDFSFPMLRQAAKKNIPETGRGLRVQGNAQRLPLPDQAFAGVLCGFGMRNLSELDAGLKECFRILEPGGVLMVAEFFRPTTWIEKAFYHGLAPLFIPALGSLAAGDKDAYVYLVESVKRFLTPKEFSAAGDAAGFRTSRILRLDGGIAHLIRLVKPTPATSPRQS